MKVLVTGAAGFIGFHLVKRLLEEKTITMVGIDNINDYYNVDLKEERLRECGINLYDTEQIQQSVTNSSYSFQKLCLTNYNNLKQLFEEQQFDYVIHTAAQAGVRYSIENPNAYVQSNLVGFANILEVCRQYDIKHLIYTSSSSVYGCHNAVPYKEADNTDYPISFYAATKKSNEVMAHSYSHLYKLPTTALRLFTAYGPSGRPDMAPMLFAENILRGKPIKVFNNGEMYRDFTYINDIIEVIYRITSIIPQQGEKHPYYRILNVGNSTPINLMDFIRALESALGKKAILDMQPIQPGDVRETYASTEELEKLINFRPSTPLTTGVNKFVDWYINNYSNRI